MITISVVAFNDKPADGSLQVHFDELGGSIGRAETNQLVLPDPERTVSRVAAQVIYRNGGFVIVDRGSNPIRLNGQALASGREAPLSPGDRVHICGYELRVDTGRTGPAAAQDPFSSLLGPSAASSPGAGLVDPLARKGARAPLAPAAAAVPGIPLDWDPFAPELADPAPQRGTTSGRGDALGLELGGAAPAALVPDLDLPSGQSSLDQLFGLAPSSGGDPLADSVLDAPMAQPNMAAHADPLQSLKSAPKASGASAPDQLSDLNRPFSPPPVVKPAMPLPSAPARAGVDVSWQAPGRAAETTQVAGAAPRFAAAPAAGHHHDDGAALLEAFRRGLDAPAVELPALTPALMEVIGQVLQQAVRGTFELLNARAKAEKGLRADAGAIASGSINPLKVSADAEVALRHLLAPPGRGFLAAAPAMREAYDDLRRQQVDLVARLQGVLEGALRTFEPAALDKRLGERPLLQGLLPAGRSGRLWEAFTAQYTKTCSDSMKEFRRSFSPAFLREYDEQAQRSQAAGGRKT